MPLKNSPGRPRTSRVVSTNAVSRPTRSRWSQGVVPPPLPPAPDDQPPALQAPGRGASDPAGSAGGRGGGAAGASSVAPQFGQRSATGSGSGFWQTGQSAIVASSVRADGLAV